MSIAGRFGRRVSAGLAAGALVAIGVGVPVGASTPPGGSARLPLHLPGGLLGGLARTVSSGLPGGLPPGPLGGPSRTLVRDARLSPGLPPPGAKALGPLPGARLVRFDVVLAPAHPGALRSLLASLYDPASPRYHHWLPRGAFVSMFAPPASEVSGVLGWLHRTGITDTTVSGFAVRAAAPARRVGTALGTSLKLYRMPSGRTGYLAGRPPLVPANLATGEVQALIGLNTLARMHPALASGATVARAKVAPKPRADGMTPCSAAQSEASTGPYYTLDALGAAYGVGSLLAAGQSGSGETIGLYELAPHSASNVSTYELCFGLTNQVSTVSVDGGAAPSTNGTVEADLDVEQAATQAPGASIISYEGPNSGSGPYDTWATIVNADAAQVVSTSWGNCEPVAYQAGWIPSFDTLLQQAAAQGQSVFAAAGDSGSEGCYAESQTIVPSTSEQVGYPASSPWVTAVGGTTLLGPGDETAWNSCQSNESTTCANQYGGQAAGGGGLSRYEPELSYQPQILSWSSAQPCGTNCREVPDISANAGVGMVVYANGAWVAVGGTSAAAPFVAGMVADRNTGCSATTGQWAPELYALYDQGAYGTAFNQITQGNTDMTGSNGGAYPAGPGYNAATGIGSPIGAGLSCPEVTSVQPSSAQPGTQVTLSGLGLEDATVSFGGTQAQVVSSDATSATVVVPQGSGSVAVSATSPLGAGSTEAGFSFVDLPAVTGLSPSAGSVAGGTSVTITGANFTPGATVAFGNEAATSVTVSSSSEITAVSPPEPSGSVEVTVTTSQGTSSSSSASLFAYQAAYTSLPGPTRICDTRGGNPSNLSGAEAQCNGKTLSPGTPLYVTVAGVAGVPAAGVSAVVLNVTATGEATGGYMTLYPAGSSQPSTSNLDFTAAKTVANLVEVGVGSNGQVVITSDTSANVIVDVEGYYGAASAAGEGSYVGIAPARICDTRSGNPSDLSGGDAQCNGRALGAGIPLSVQVAGNGGVPSTGVMAVVVDLTAVGYSSGGYMTAYPAGETPPTASNVNFAPGEGPVPNSVIVPVSSTGAIDLVSDVATDAIVDVSGYFTAAGSSGTGGQFNAEAAPVRIMDTRCSASPPPSFCQGESIPAANSGLGMLGAGQTMTVQVGGLAGVPANATAVALNVTATSTTANGFLSVNPVVTPPSTSDLDWTAGETVPDLVIAVLSSSGTITLYNFSGSVNVVVDVMGWYR